MELRRLAKRIEIRLKATYPELANDNEIFPLDERDVTPGGRLAKI